MKGAPATGASRLVENNFDAFKGWKNMKIHWSPNMMTFVGALILGLVASIAFVAVVRGHGGGAFAFITISMIGTGMFVAGLLLNHDNRFANNQEQQTEQAQLSQVK
jgi:hypothetical protein